MSIYNITLNNGSVVQMNIIESDTTVQEEIIKFESTLTGQPSLSWPTNPPTSVISYSQIS